MPDVSDIDPSPSAAPAMIPSSALGQWLWTEGWSIAGLADLTRGLGRAMNSAGVPVCRLRLTLRTLHPQLAGISHTWRRRSDEVEEFWPPLSILQDDVFLKSPYALIYQGAAAVRRRLDLGEPIDFPILEELRAEGATDYVALPLVFGDGRIHAATFATDRAGGFRTGDLQTIYDAMPMLARLLEVHALRRTAKTVMETYLGRLTGERVLDGSIHRGDGEDIHAVIWLCDMRDSTRLADTMPRLEFLDLLNGFFDCMAGAVMNHGGEVLKFIGDSVLGIFPIGPPVDRPEACSRHRRACAAGLAAAKEAMRRMREMDDARASRGEPPLGFGIAIHLGDVTWGNVGAANRLDFTVIGPAANEAARLESLCKSLGRCLVVSEPVAQLLDEPLEPLGEHPLRGLPRAYRLFTPRD